MIQFSRPQALVLAKLASYFKIPKAELRGDAFTASGQDNSLLNSTLLSERGFVHWLRCVDGRVFALKNFVNWKKFEASDLYMEFLLGEGMLAINEQPRYLLAMYAGGSAWVVRRCRSKTGYQGGGGWYIHQQPGFNAFIIEPLVNFLADHCPPPESD